MSRAPQTNRCQSLLGLAKIMRMAFDGDDLELLYNSLAERIQQDSTDAAAMLDMNVVLQLRAQSEIALELQWQGLQQQQHYRLASNPVQPAVRVLAIMSPGEVMANTPIEFLLESSDVALETLYIGAGLPMVHDIPKHDVAFVAVCESDKNQALLRQLHQLMEYWPQPHVNSPARIAELARNRVAENLREVEGVEVVQAQRFSRAALKSVKDLGLAFPIIVRPVDSHAGRGLSKIESTGELSSYLIEHLDDEFFVAPFVDYRSADGQYRKYRIASVAGRAYPAHMAVSPRWMVHYLNADMLDSAANRKQEAKFMDSFDWEFGAKHGPALAAIDQIIKLDYYSLDCAETKDGRLLVFELDSGAVVHAMDPIALFAYKRPHMQKLFSAFRALLMVKARKLQPSKSRRHVA